MRNSEFEICAWEAHPIFFCVCSYHSNYIELIWTNTENLSPEYFLKPTFTLHSGLNSQVFVVLARNDKVNSGIKGIAGN